MNDEMLKIKLTPEQAFLMVVYLKRQTVYSMQSGDEALAVYQTLQALKEELNSD